MSLALAAHWWTFALAWLPVLGPPPSVGLRVAGCAIAAQENARFAILEGLVIDDATGAPIVDTRITIHDEVTGAVRHCRTDSEGRFTARPFAIDHALRAELPDSRPRRFAARIHPLLPGTERRTIRFVEVVTMRGRVRFLDSGEPCESAIVSAECGDALVVSHHTGGSFTIDGIPAAASEDAPPRFVRIAAKSATGFEIITFVPRARLSEDIEWPVYVGAGCSLEVHVARADGASGPPGYRAWLEIEEPRDALARLDDGLWRTIPMLRGKETIGVTNGEPPGPRTADADGRIRFSGLPPRVGYRLVVDLPNGITLDRSLPGFDVDGSRHSMTLVAPDHRGVLEFEARLRGGPCTARVSWSRKGVHGWLETGPEGTSRVEGLPLGPLTITAFLEPGSIRIERRVEIPEDGVISLRLESRDENAIRGRVVDRSGTAMPGVRVGLCKAPNDAIGDCVIRTRDPVAEPFDTFVQSDSAGEFVFAGLPEGRFFWVDVADPRFEDLTISATARGSDGIELLATPN